MKKVIAITVFVQLLLAPLLTVGCGPSYWEVNPRSSAGVTTSWVDQRYGMSGCVKKTSPLILKNESGEMRRIRMVWYFKGEKTMWVKTLPPGETLTAEIYKSQQGIHVLSESGGVIGTMDIGFTNKPREEASL